MSQQDTDPGHPDQVAALERRIAELEEQNAALSARLLIKRIKLAEFNTIAETAPVGILVANKDGRITYGNPLVEEMLRHPIRYSENVESYYEWVSYHHSGRRVKAEEYPLSQVLSGADYSELDVHYERGDGTRFWLRVIGRPVRDADGNRIGAAVALIDIDDEIRMQARQKVLIHELNHRVKNAFSVVKSIVNQSLRYSTVDPDLRDKLDKRLEAYSSAHSRLMETKWESCDFRQLIADIADRTAPERIRYDGPVFQVCNTQALAFSMAFYELTTNAVKYGALSIPEGHVEVTWSIREQDGETLFQVTWRELNGPEVVKATSKGFGSFITNRAIALETGGSVRLDFEPEGIVWQCEMPIDEEDQK